MAATIQDVQDLIRLLRQHPEWRAEFERALLGEELLSLPAIVRELAEAQKRTEARVEELAEAQKRTEARVEELAEAQKRTEARLDQLTLRVGELAEAQKRTEARMEELTSHVMTLTAVTKQMRGDIGDLRGELLELRYAERVPAYVSDFFRRSRVVPRQEYVTQLEEAEDAGKISAAERQDASRIDLLLRGQRLPDHSPAYLAIEVSATIHEDDVDRAARRAEIFRRIYPIVIPAVGGHGIVAEARKRAEIQDVKITLDGVTMTFGPGEEQQQNHV